MNSWKIKTNRNPLTLVSGETITEAISNFNEQKRAYLKAAGLEETKFMDVINSFEFVGAMTDHPRELRYEESLRRSDDLMRHLVEANEVIRSAHSIAERRGSETNWEAFTDRVAVILEKQHKIIYPA